MKNVMKYISLMASIIAIITVAVAGIKIAGNNYNVVVEGWIMGICLIVLFACAIYNIAKDRK